MAGAQTKVHAMRVGANHQQKVFTENFLMLILIGSMTSDVSLG